MKRREGEETKRGDNTENAEATASDNLKERKATTRPSVILPYPDGRAGEAFKVLQRSVAMTVSDAEASPKERRAAETQ